MRDVADKLLLGCEGVSRWSKRYAGDNVAEEDGRKCNYAKNYCEALALDRCDFFNNCRCEGVWRCARGTLAHPLRNRRRHVMVEEGERGPHEAKNNKRESYLEADDVDLCAEEWIEAVLIEPDGSQFRGPFPIVSQRPRRVFGEGF